MYAITLGWFSNINIPYPINVYSYKAGLSCKASIQSTIQACTKSSSFYELKLSREYRVNSQIDASVFSTNCTWGFSQYTHMNDIRHQIDDSIYRLSNARCYKLCKCSKPTKNIESKQQNNVIRLTLWYNVLYKCFILKAHMQSCFIFLSVWNYAFWNIF